MRVESTSKKKEERATRYYKDAACFCHLQSAQLEVPYFLRQIRCRQFACSRHQRGPIPTLLRSAPRGAAVNSSS